MRLFYSFALVSLLILMPLSFAKTKLVFVSEEWPGATHADGTGVYWQVIRKVFAPHGYDIEFKTMPYSRAQKLVRLNKAQALVGAYPGEIEGLVYSKQAIDYDQVVALFKPSTIISWQGQRSLMNKKVAWIRGYHYDRYLSVHIAKRKEVRNPEIGINLLAHGRVDVYLDAKASLLDFLAVQGVEPGTYVMKDLMRIPLLLGFANSALGKELAAIFDQRLQQLIQSGQLKPIYQYYQYQYPF